MSWRRISIVIAAIATLAAASLAAASVGSSAPKGGDVTTITFWNGFTGPDRPALEKVVKAFNDSHPTMKVEMTRIT